MGSWDVYCRNETSNISYDGVDAFFLCNGINGGTIYLSMLAVFCAVGIAGNSVALSIFCSRLRRPAQLTFRNHYNFFTLALAVCDLIVCAVRIPYEVLLVMNLVNDEAVCKIAGYISHVVSMFASLIHVGICTERYYAVCKPLSPFSTTQVSSIIGLIALVASVLSIPSAFVFSVYDTSAFNVKGCHYQHWIPLGLSYNAILCTLMIMSVVAVMSVYGIIFREIVRRITKADISTTAGTNERGATNGE